MNGDRAFIAVMAVFVSVLVLIWRSERRKRRARPPNPGLDLIREAMTGPLRRYPVHLYGPEGTPFETECCGRDVFSLPEDHRITPDERRSTCAGRQP